MANPLPPSKPGLGSQSAASVLSSAGSLSSAPSAPAGVSRICVVIGRTRHKMMQVEIQEAAKRGAQMIELRLDFLAKAPDFKRLLAHKPCPMVATVRRPVDGGRWSGSEDERRMLLRQAIVAGFDWVDVEMDIADSIPRYGDVKRIVSYHNLRETPKDIDQIHSQMCKLDADVVKIAVTAHDPADNVRVLDLLKQPARPTVAMCMGDLGLPSRILAARFGAPFTYGALNPDRVMAPGMLTFEELRHVYHYELLNAATAVYGLIGDPVAHSLSPLVHNRAFRKLGINAIYLPFRVPRGELTAFLRNFDRHGVRGYSVTIPHKEAACSVAIERDSVVDRIQAANTLLRVTDGWSAYNTDVPAAVESLKANLPQASDGSPPTPLSARSVLILGAGGVARAVAHALAKEVGMLTISNRTAERANTLAEEVDCRVVDWAARHSVMCDVVINCTSVGMTPNVDESPLHSSFLKPGLIVFDAVYTPETTLLVKEAKERGCHVLTGVDMFVRQAALQFKLFTGQEAPLDLIRAVVRRALSPLAMREEG